MLYVPISRETLLRLMAKGGEVVEIGTFKGDFAQAIFDTVQPDHLHLVDPWRHQDQADYASDASNLPDSGHEENLAQVRERFQGAIEGGVVSVHRMESSTAAPGFEDRSLDWAYIDGMHTYDAVREDLALWEPKVREGGLILGHDYIDGPGYGVIPAVDEFIRERGWEMIILTMEAAATFVLAKDTGGEAATSLLDRLVYNVPGIIEIRDFPGRPLAVRTKTFPDGTLRQYPSF